MKIRPIDANELRQNIETWIQEYNDGTIGGLSLDDVLDYIDTAPTIERQWLIIQNTLNETHLLKESRKHIAMAARTTMELDAVLAVLAMPLMLWKMPQQP